MADNYYRLLQYAGNSQCRSYITNLLKGGKMDDLNSNKIEELYLQKLEESKGLCQTTLWNLAHLYKKANRLQEARIFMLKHLHLSVNDEERASSLLALGQIMENMNDHASAAEDRKSVV